MYVVNEGERTALEEMGEAVNPKIKGFFSPWETKTNKLWVDSYEAPSHLGIS